MMAGAGMEASKLKISLQDAIAGKSIAEDMNAALQVFLLALNLVLT